MCIRDRAVPLRRRQGFLRAGPACGPGPRNFLQAAALDLSAPGHRGVRFKRHPAVAHMVGLRLPEVRAQAPEGNGLSLIHIFFIVFCPLSPLRASGCENGLLHEKGGNQAG